MLYLKYLKQVLIIAVVCFSVFSYSQAQEKDIPLEYYKASTIPDSLKEDANAVLRYSMQEMNVKGPGKMTERVHTIYTILNENGNDEAGIALPYNKKFGAVSSFEMRVYDADGKLIKKYLKGDMYEHAAGDYGSLVTDDKVMLIGHTIARYPSTVEMIYEVENNSLIDLGTWQIQFPEQSIQNSTYRITISSDAGFRYLNKNTNIKPQKSTIGDKDIYTWQVANLKAFKLEEDAVTWKVLPKIAFAANKFEFYGLSGDISTWQSFGKWIQGLNNDVCTLNEPRIQEIRKMTDTIKTDKGKAKFLYKYMQQSMRYVSIQLGIGGLKPFAATFVDDKKYGDCKALSNYMYALLKAAGIKSYYAIINAEANKEPASYAFPYNGFNHVILCVPFKSDTTWLECTSNTQQFGVLGSFTENRNALLITEDGGKLVSTPKSVAKENQFNCETHIVLAADGGAKAHVKIKNTGEYRSVFVDGLPRLKTDQQKEYLLRNFEIKQPDIFEFKSGQDIEGVKEAELDLEYVKFCDVMAGDKRFYTPMVLTLWDVSVPILEKRKTDFYFDCPRQKSCITTIDLPAGFEVETLPVNTSLKFTYGNYELNYVYNKDKNQVISTAKFILDNHVIPAAKYTEMQQYLDAVVKAQNKKLVIRKKA